MHQPLRFLFLFAAGLVGLYLLWAVLYEVLLHLGGRGPIIAAIVVFVALVWEIATSGHTITNVDGKWFPRRSRVFLFFGYVMFAVAIILFWGSLRGDDELGLEIAHLYAESEAHVQAGIAQLGPALLLTLLIVRLGRWRASRTAAASAANGLPLAGSAIAE